MGLLQEFTEEGFLERVVMAGQSSSGTKEVPKVNQDMPQSTTSTKADMPANGQETPEPDDKKPDDEDPSKSADDNKHTDKKMHAAAITMKAAEAVMEALCESCEKGDTDYDEDKKNKIHECYESAKGLTSNLYEMANMESY